MLQAQIWGTPNTPLIAPFKNELMFLLFLQSFYHLIPVHIIDTVQWAVENLINCWKINSRQTKCGTCARRSPGRGSISFTEAERVWLQPAALSVLVLSTLLSYSKAQSKWSQWIQTFATKMHLKNENQMQKQPLDRSRNRDKAIFLLLLCAAFSKIHSCPSLRAHHSLFNV